MIFISFFFVVVTERIEELLKLMAEARTIYMRDKEDLCSVQNGQADDRLQDLLLQISELVLKMCLLFPNLTALYVLLCKAEAGFNSALKIFSGKRDKKRPN